MSSDTTSLISSFNTFSQPVNEQVIPTPMLDTTNPLNLVFQEINKILESGAGYGGNQGAKKVLDRTYEIIEKCMIPLPIEEDEKLSASDERTNKILCVFKRDIEDYLKEVEVNRAKVKKYEIESKEKRDFDNHFQEIKRRYKQLESMQTSIYRAGRAYFLLSIFTGFGDGYLKRKKITLPTINLKYLSFGFFWAGFALFIYNTSALKESFKLKYRLEWLKHVRNDKVQKALDVICYQSLFVAKDPYIKAWLHKLPKQDEINVPQTRPIFKTAKVMSFIILKFLGFL